MFDKKRLLINCDVCDARTMKEEDYSGYEEILINADVLLVSERSKSILNRLPITSNVDDTLEVADDFKLNLQSFNGYYEITKAAGVAEHTVLCVNGHLMIRPGTEEVLKNYEKIYVNGCAKYPKSLENSLPDISVNGHMSSYPDDCIMLESRLVLDKYFPMRAKENCRYYVEDEVILADGSVDLAMLAEKKVQFVTKRFIVPESKVGESIALFDETVKLVVIPEGMKAICENVFLDNALLEKCGDRVYVYGDLTVTEDSMQAMQALKELQVEGTVFIKRNCMEAFEQLHAKYKELCPLRREIKNKMSATVDGNVLKASPDGLLVKNVAKLMITDEVTPQAIVELLEVKNCQSIYCNQEQKSSIELVSNNVAMIETEAKDGEEKGSTGIFSQIAQGIGFLKDTKLINAESYIL